MFYEVIPAKVIGKSSISVLTYSSDLELSPGHIVSVPLRNSKVPGIVIKKVKEPNFKVKPIEKPLYEKPLPSHLLESISWLSEYYQDSLPSVASCVLPPGIIKTRRKADESDSPRQAFSAKIPINADQKQALERIRSVKTATKLLFGITGSGKTNIYLKLAEDTLKQHKSVILLVPEIALTSQLVQVFEQVFSKNIILLHSKQTEKERHLSWEKILNSTSPEIVIGPRSAIFAPVENLGLIIIDEAHESSFYQENSPKYSAIKLASFIANYLKITCLLGTATPPVADYYLAARHQAVIPLVKKAKANTRPPEVQIIDLTNRSDFGKNRYFSTPLLNAIENNLKKGYQTLIFHNRRGSAPLTICENCGWQALCKTCFLPLTLHSDSFSLLCHTCGQKEPVPMNCPNCKSPNLLHKGFGTKLLETELHKLFKDARIARFDADNSKAETLDALYDKVKNGDFDIIIGTQTVTKGFDFPLLATVGIVQADSGLNLPDFAAEEHTFELLTQVIGRVGRGHLSAASVYIQTYQPEHPAIKYASVADYEAFSNYLLKNRKKAKLPPFTFLAKLSLTYKTEAAVLKYLKAYHKTLSNVPGLSVSLPTPAFHEKSSQGYTWQLILKSPSRKALLAAISSLKPNPRLRVSLDPPSLL